MKKLFFIFILFFTFSVSNLYAQQYSGKNLFNFGDSTSSLGRAGTGVSVEGTENFYINPAAIADAERLGFGLQFGIAGGGLYNPDLSVAIPYAYGTLGITYRGIFLGTSTDFTQGHYFSIGHSKKLLDRLLVGFSVNFFYGFDATGTNFFYPGASIGFIYRFQGMKKTKGWGFFSPNLASSLNFGLPISAGSSGVAISNTPNFNILTIGTNFDIYRSKKFDLGLYLDVTALNYVQFPVKFGFEATIIKSIIVRFGFIVPPINDYGYGYGDITAGVGYKFSKETFAGSVNYALTYDLQGNLTHSIAFNFEYGKLDRTPPKISEKPDLTNFSPNFDGKDDYIHFSQKVDDDSRIKGWKLQILNDKGKLVKEYRMSERDVVQGLSFTGFFKKIFQKKESMIVPDKILWDGTDKKGKMQKDGRYTYAFVAWDERDNIAKKRTGYLYLDNTPPEVKLSINDKLFSPNGDNKKDEFIIKQKIKSSPEDVWVAGFKDSKGKVVKSYKWTGNKVPSKVAWNGKDDKGKDVHEGLYYYFIKSSDKAGNSDNEAVKEISLTRKYETTDIRLEKKYYSYKLKNKKHNFNLFTVISKKKGLKQWEIDVTDKNDKLIKKITGGREFPSVVKWNVLNSKNKKLNSGQYFIQLKTIFDNGNTPSSFKKKLIIDSEAPVLEVFPDSVLFSPDGDGENDTLDITMRGKDDFGIKKWAVKIYDPDGDLFKEFKGEGNLPKKIIWDGFSDKKELVESATDYVIQIEAEDFAGNVSFSKKKKISVDILIMVTDRGLKIRISNIQFGFASASLRKSSYKVLNRLAQLLKKYENYHIMVEGHTDDIGSDEANLKLSEARAKSVRRYMIYKGVKAERLEYRGLGESMPLHPNTNAKNRRKNRRVEFLLIKDIKKFEAEQEAEKLAKQKEEEAQAEKENKDKNKTEKEQTSSPQKTK